MPRDLSWVVYYNIGDEVAEANGQEMFDILCEIYQTAAIPGQWEKWVELAIERIEDFFESLPPGSTSVRMNKY
jgi:hypothetical protein